MEQKQNTPWRFIQARVSQAQHKEFRLLMAEIDMSATEFVLEAIARKQLEIKQTKETND